MLQREETGLLLGRRMLLCALPVLLEARLPTLPTFSDHRIPRFADEQHITRAIQAFRVDP